MWPLKGFPSRSILDTASSRCIELFPLQNLSVHMILFVSDPRVKGWLLLENYTPTFIFSVLYLLIVWLGPKYMRNKQPFSCRGILVVYNLGLTLLSLYMFYEVGKNGLGQGYLEVSVLFIFVYVEN